MSATTLRASYTFSAPVLQRFNAVVPHGERSRVMEELMKQALALREAVVLGPWQAVALIPGTSRSGACMTGARLLGLERVEAARIATLMSIPTILASGALLVAEIAATVLYSDNRGNIAGLRELAGVLALQIRF